jgi:hypothetical protein
MSEEDWLSKEEESELDGHETRKVNRERAWKDSQLDRIEQTVNRTQNTVRGIGFFGFLILLAIWFSVT